MLRRAPLFLSASGLLLVSASAVGTWAPRLIWNATGSAPEGLYALQPGAALQVGELVAIRPPLLLAGWLDARGYAPAGVVLVKSVAALAPSWICRQGARVTVDGALVARAEPVDRWGRTLPIWSGCRRLGPDEIFLLNAARGSLDGRYFGALPRVAVVGRLSPIWLIRSARHAG